MKYLTLTPAYGRDYKNKKDILADWNAGKDFVVADIGSGGYINKEDAEKDSTIRSVNIRYKNLTQVCVIKVH